MKQAENQPDKEQTFHSRSLTNRRTRSSKPPQNRIHRRWGSVATVLTALVVVFTVYYLVLPGITLEKDQAENMSGIHLSSSLDCPVQIHQHDESCYKEIPVYDENGEKTGTEKTLVCGQADYMIHQHDENCYDENGTLVCPLPEVEEHHHTDACYQDEVLVCGQQELHTHTEKCYDKDGNLICGLLELKKHEHGEECFAKEREKEDTIQPAADSSADISATDEEPKDITGKESTSAAVEETDPGAPSDQTDLEDSQKTESSSDENDATELSESEASKTNQNNPTADTSETDTNKKDSQTLSVQGKDFKIDVSFDPEAGIPEGTVLEAEEILSGSKEWKKYYRAVLKEVKKETFPDKDNGKSKTTDGDTETDAFAGATSDTDTWVSEEPVEADAISQVTDARFFDIRLIHNGKIIEPEAPVDVTIRYDESTNATMTARPMVAHFADEGLEMIKPTISQSQTDEPGVDTYEFVQDSFSITGTFFQAQNITNLKNGSKYLIMCKGQNADGESIWRVLSADESRNYTITGPGNYTVKEMATQYCDSTCIWTLTVNNTYDVHTRSWTKSYVLYNEETKKYLTLQGSNNTSDGMMSQEPIGLGLGVDSGNKFWIGNGWNWDNGYFGWGSGYYWDGDQARYLGILNNSNQIYVNKGSDSKNGLEFHEIQPVAVDDKNPPPDPVIPNSDLVEKFKQEIQDSTPIKEGTKTAEVYDYDNRIYQIDLTAKSGYRAMDQDIELAFITDVSNSMLFASNITPTNKTYSYKQDYYGNITGDVSGFTDKNQVYIIIGDPTQESCHYAVWWDTSQNQWVAVDASYYAKRKYYESTGIKLLDSKGKSPEDWWGRNRTPKKLSTEAFTGKFNSNTQYTIYTPTDDAWLSGFGDIFSKSSNAQNRLYYLKKNVEMAIDAMKVVAGTTDNSSVRVALETFCKNVPDNGFDFRDVKNINDLNTYLDNITTADGTNQRWALKQFNEGIDGKEDYAKNWSASDGKKKYVIMISDGSPNVKNGDGSQELGIETYNTPANVHAQVENLEKKGATVFSIGLSMGDVIYGKQIMASVASDVNENYYLAENENEFEEVFYDILRKIIADATVIGKVEDVIDEGFYPVDKEGNVLSEGSYIDATGVLINEPADKETTPYGQITKVNNEYKVTWYNQSITWDGWHGTVYVKAREDYLGGNSINTNDGMAKISPEKFYVSLDSKTGKPKTITLPADKKTKVEELSTPYVNIDELALTNEKTEWTVYLNETVDPLTQLKGMYDDINVLEVVTGSGSDHRMTGKDTMIFDTTFGDGDDVNAAKWNDIREPKANKTPETFPLKDVIKNAAVVAGEDRDSSIISNNISGSGYFDEEGNLTDQGWKTLLDGDTIYLRYEKYGHTSGVIKLHLEASDNNTGEPLLTSSSYDNEKGGTGHKTEVAKPKAESYTLTADYKAYPKNVADENYKTGSYRTSHAGAITDEMHSINEHVINVFDAGLKLHKVDMTTGNEITESSAEFFLLRKAQGNEAVATLSDEVKNQLRAAGEDPGAKWYIYRTITTGSGGKPTAENIEKLESGCYYLVESRAPEGYSELPKAMEVSVDTQPSQSLSNKTAAINSKPINNAGTATPQNRTDQATILIRGGDQNGYVEKIVPTSGAQYLDASGLVEWKVKNSQGYELPSTGGFGTHCFYILGAILILVSSLMLAAKKRSKRYGE